MTHRGDRSLQVSALVRVEGEGAMRVRVDGGTVTEVALDIYEPPRIFEAMLRGRHHTEPPDITARICGICPVAYQMSACLAIEPPAGMRRRADRRAAPAAVLRRGIQSHTLHVYLLHAPDFTAACEQAIRNYDPCISCATHFLDLTVERV